MNNEYRSQEELYFSWYLDELQLKGYIEKYEYEPAPYKIFNKAITSWEEQKKTKVNLRDAHLIDESEYTVDFRIYWTEKAKGVFIGGKPSWKRPYFLGCEFSPIFDKGISTIDVKGDVLAHQGRKNYGAFSFPFKQKLMWLVNGIYVQKVVPIKLFRDTFVPKRYMFTDSGKQTRKITIKKAGKRVMMEIRTLEEYVDMVKVKEDNGAQQNIF